MRVGALWACLVTTSLLSKEIKMKEGAGLIVMSKAILPTRRHSKHKSPKTHEHLMAGVGEGVSSKCVPDPLGHPALSQGACLPWIPRAHWETRFCLALFLKRNT